ncbi:MULTISPECIES: hypothetical protein [unclassified Acinetobacter]|uniref:hypothetical protein n=1 Tax=unclassified Acinetobacter TaxID=196816 RepID=UPI00244BC518|nr:MULTISPECIES: hypothetical protein [unclassified Acinetobacter]MDH0032009.1 hypothetical protein [Acinetobacter sp. GD04021]MDH0887665.1 hypothetical protein [Acinetobacter sp. GD03873]MDH1084013.1 hypothetical protein [Acinetobacter sp. GD03983]MDH2191060.1 hypothetical protein [Acinetobacter sp. GD03645]MDH2204525.1 hypothetical protein [Acinetobacter sp. GD03647]
MNDFFLANNESLPYTFIDQNIHISQIQVKNLNQFAYYAKPIKKLDSYSVEMIQTIIDEHIVKIMGLCSLVTSLDPDVFSKHIGNQDATAELILKIIQVNEAYFKEEKPKKRQRENQKKYSWFDSFQHLISEGHRPDDILNMSYGAFTEYLKAAQRRESQRLKTIAIATRAASAKNNDFDKFVSGLDG